MTFVPRMQNCIEGVTVLRDLKWRAWPGVVADVWDVHCAAGARGDYLSPDPRFFIALEHDASASIVLHAPKSAHPTLKRTWVEGPISFIPAGVRLRTHVEQDLRLRHLDLHLDADMLTQRLGEAGALHDIATPRLTFPDEHVMTLARQVAQLCLSPGGADNLYSDSLLTALLAAAFGVRGGEGRRRPLLTLWQLRRVTEFIDANCQRRIRLDEVAALTGLSQSHFSHAFKATTGLPPYQWQMRARIERTKELLDEVDIALSDIAVRMGFADQAHLTRTFRRFTGHTPAAWQRQHGREQF